MPNTPKLVTKRRFDAPCYNCSDRAPNCHGVCEKYKAYKQTTFEDWQKRRDAYYSEAEAEDYIITTNTKFKKRRIRR